MDTRPSASWTSSSPSWRSATATDRGSSTPARSVPVSRHPRPEGALVHRDHLTRDVVEAQAVVKEPPRAVAHRGAESGVCAQPSQRFADPVGLEWNDEARLVLG